VGDSGEKGKGCSERFVEAKKALSKSGKYFIKCPGREGLAYFAERERLQNGSKPML
jgi:hypothetical protein